MKRLLSGLILITFLTGLTGCKHANRQPAPAVIAPAVPGGQFIPAPTPAPGFQPGPGFQPAAPGFVQPVPGVTGPATVPGNGIPPPLPPTGPAPGPVPGPVPPPPMPPPSISGFPAPPTQAHWRPVPGEPVQPVEARGAEPRIQLAAPEPLFGESPPRETASDVSPEPPILPRKAKTTLPVGIPQFAQALNDVHSGLRPSIDDGLDWLAANGYRTVLHLRAPGEPNDADRAQVEKFGMTYLSLEVSPQTLTREKVEEFIGIVQDVARRPLFVYDQDGSLTGPLWYLYFRTVENHDDEVARLRANALGLREDREGQHRLMWLAVQKVLADQ